MRTLRSRRLRSALYLAAGGRCALCGEPLGSGWHADHVAPWSQTHRTNVHEMQALCPACNLRKGSRPVSYALRPFQAEFVERALFLAQQRNRLRVLVANVYPGSGKTSAYALASDALKRHDHIDQVAIFAPRLNLARQAESDWERLRRVVPGAMLGPIEARENVPPLVRGEAGGYATTYQALMANPDLHLFEVRRRRTLVVFDEAQQLGVESEYGLGTRSADVARRLADAAALVFVLSGTPTRADGRPLLLARYGEPDGEGFRELKADVAATYLQGVAGGYLREFEFHLHDGRAMWQWLGENPEELELSKLERGLGKVLRQPGYWEPLVRRFAGKVAEVQREIHPRLRGLIAAADQAHAQEIMAFLRHECPAMRALLAVHDEEAAQDNLRRFRAGEGDILVTVAMAHVGYDCPEIMVVLPLTTARTDAYLAQLFARGARMMDGETIERADQVLYVLAPDDRRMASFCERLRAESRAGARQHEEREEAEAQERNQAQQRMGIGFDAELGSVRAMGLNPRGDLDSTGLAAIAAARTVAGLSPALAATKLAAFVQVVNAGTVPGDSAQSEPTPVGAQETAHEREMRLRRLISKAASACDRFVMEHNPDWQRGGTHHCAVRHFGKGVKECSEAELAARLRWIIEFQREKRRLYDGELVQ